MLFRFTLGLTQPERNETVCPIRKGCRLPQALPCSIPFAMCRTASETKQWLLNIY